MCLTLVSSSTSTLNLGQPGVEPYYPVNNDKNNAVYEQYAFRAAEEKNVIFGGRLGQYKYYDMDKVVAAALNCVDEEL